MTELQILSRVLNQKSMNIINSNYMTDDYFQVYIEEYQYIKGHFSKYGNVPDKETFLARFPDFDIVEVAESDQYLVDAFEEEHLYSITVPVLNKIGELIQTDSNKAVEYLQSQLPNLTAKSKIVGKNIVADADERLQEWIKRKNEPQKYMIPTGFKEIDEVVGGFQKGEELAVILARTGNGKTWVVVKMLEHAWKMNQRVGLVEPEMSFNKTGYRFDTIHGHISSRTLTQGKDNADYEPYIEELKTHEIPFYVIHPKDMQRRVTVSKLRTFIESNNLDMLAIDGISYLTDERALRGDNTTTKLTHISEDLMDLSIELGIPIIVVVQANREGARNEDLEVENVRDSDGIAYNASLLFTIQQKEEGLQIAIKKNRNGENNVKRLYMWDIDKGVFNYIPSSESGRDETESSEELRSQYKDEREVF